MCVLQNFSSIASCSLLENISVNDVNRVRKFRGQHKNILSINSGCIVCHYHRR